MHQLGPQSQRAVASCSAASRVSNFRSLPSTPLLMRTRRSPAVTCAAEPDGFEDAKRNAKKWVADIKLDEKAAKVKTWVADNKLDEKAAKAAESVKSAAYEAWDNVSSSARSTYTRLESEYRFEKKVASAGRRVKEAWRDVDQEYGIRRKLGNAQREVQRNWPGWKKNLDAFLETPLGKVAAVAALLTIVQLPIFWSIFNTLFLLWWLAIPVLLLLLSLFGDEAARIVEEQQELEQQEAEMNANPFQDIFNTRPQERESGFKNRWTGGASDDEGPIIDADYVVLDKDDKK
eukprot:gene10239-8156_t